MAIVHADQAGAYSASTASITSSAFSTTVASGDLLVAGLSFGTATDPVVTFTDNKGGNNWQDTGIVLEGDVGGPNPFRMRCFFCVVTNGGSSMTVTASWTGAISSVRLHVHRVTGLPNAVVDKTRVNAGAAGTSVMTSNTVTTTASDEFAWGYGIDGGGSQTQSGSWSAGITEQSEIDEWQVLSSTQTLAATYTYADQGTYICAIVTFRTFVPTKPTGPFPTYRPDLP